MVLANYIDRVISLYSKGAQSIDSRLSPRLIYDKLKSSRSRLVILKANKKQSIIGSKQNLNCIKLIRAPKIECPCVPPSGCTFLRSEEPIPKFLESLFGPLTGTVMTLDGSVNFSLTSRNRIRAQVTERYTGRSPRAFIDKYLYILGNSSPKFVSLYGGVFEDPIEIFKLNNRCNGDDDICDDILDSEFPIDSDLVDPLIQLTTEELVTTFAKMRQDVRNNASDDTVDDTEDNKIKEANAKRRRDRYEDNTQ